jgi:predicted Na+-dependent transporter
LDWFSWIGFNCSFILDWFSWIGLVGLVLIVLLFFSVNINGMVSWFYRVFIGFIGVGLLVLFSWVYSFGCGVLELVDFINEK